MRTIENPAENSSLSSEIIREELQNLENEIASPSAGHDHDGSDSKTVSHTNLADKGTNTHAQIDTALTRLANTSGTNTGDQTLPTDATLSVSDVTTNNASTSKHGFSPKATAPSAGNINVLAIANGETVRSDKALFDATAPSTQSFGDAANAGTATVSARRDHKHAMPASEKDKTAITGILKGNGTDISAASAGTDYVAPGGALGTPASGTLTNCTFPTLNQNTTGTSSSLSTTAKATTYLGSNQTINTGSWTKVSLDTEVFDPGNNFASNKFTCPVTGYYLIHGQIKISPATADKRYIVGISTGGATTPQYYNVVNASVADDIGANIFTILYLTATTTIELYVFHDAGVNKTLIAGSTATLMNVHLIST